MSAEVVGEDRRRRVIGQKVLRPRQQVEETLRAAILSGELKSGEMLPPETELARQFDVSRTTLREALRVLTSQRLITKVPGARGGNIVQSVDYQSLGAVVMESVDNLLALGTIDFDELADMRQLLEVPSVRLAAAHRSSDDLRDNGAHRGRIVCVAAIIGDNVVPAYRQTAVAAGSALGVA